MRFREFKRLIRADLYRFTGRSGMRALLRELVFGDTFQYVFWFRTSQFTRSRKPLKFTAYPFARFLWRKYTYRYTIDIPLATVIGAGLYLPHFGGIVINHEARIGKNCTISHGVTIGKASRGSRQGTPIIGNNVFIGPGAKVIGAITVGNQAAIGANCVVIKDVPDSAVVAGIPAQVISMAGSEEYVVRTDYRDDQAEHTS